MNNPYEASQVKPEPYYSDLFDKLTVIFGIAAAPFVIISAISIILGILVSYIWPYMLYLSIIYYPEYDIESAIVVTILNMIFNTMIISSIIQTKKDRKKWQQAKQ